MKIFTGLMAVVFAASMTQACGSSDSDDTTNAGNSAGSDNSDNSGNNGGSAAGGSSNGGSAAGGAATGGTSNGGSAAGGGGNGVECGNSGLCGDVDVMGVVSLVACCPEGVQDKCGVDVTPAGAFIPGLAGCMELEQEGTPDSDCSDEEFTNPLDQSAIPLPGCCMSSGKCGVEVDLSGLVGSKLDFGCADPTDFIDGYTQVACSN